MSNQTSLLNLPTGPVSDSSRILAIDPQTNNAFYASMESVAQAIESYYNLASHIYTVAEHNLANYSTSNLLVLYPHNVAIAQFANATSVSLPIKMAPNEFYEIYVVSFNPTSSLTASTNYVELRPNGNTYSTQFRHSSTSGENYTGYSSFVISKGYTIAQVILGYTTEYRLLLSNCLMYGNSSFGTNGMKKDAYGSEWYQYGSNQWTYMGSIVFPQQTTGLVSVRKILQA